MFDIGKRVFILKKACGKVYKISLTRNNEIVLSCLNRERIGCDPPQPGVRLRENSWGGALPLRREAHQLFSACIDSKDDIHILCQDYSKNIVHIQLKSGQERLVQTIESEAAGNIPNMFPEILQADGKVMLFHVTGDTSDCRIAVHSLDAADSPVQQEAIDDAVYTKAPYLAVADGRQNPYLFYNKKTGDTYVAGYKKFLSGTGAWSDFSQASYCGENSDLLSAAVDCQDNIYILRQADSPQGYELICTVKRFGEDKWVDHIIWSHDKYPFCNSSVTALENCIIIYWFMENSIYYRLSVDNGLTWGKRETYEFKDSAPLCCISYRSNMRGEYEGSCINPLPGKIGAGFQLAFLNDFYPRPSHLITDELRELISRLLGQSTHGMELLRQSVADLGKRLETLDARLESLEKASAARPEKKSRSSGPSADRRPDTAAEAGAGASSSLMPGLGFTGVTPEYLKNLRKKD